MTTVKDALAAFVAEREVVRVDSRAARRIKVVAGDGTIKEATSADLLAGLLQKHEVKADVDDAAQRAKDAARRSVGLPDECDDCGASLSMLGVQVQKRTLRGHPWRCHPCHAKTRRSWVEASCVGCGKPLRRRPPDDRLGRAPEQAKCLACYHAEQGAHKRKTCIGCSAKLWSGNKSGWCARCHTSAKNPDRPGPPTAPKWPCTSCGGPRTKRGGTGLCGGCARRAPRAPMSDEQRARISAKMQGNQNARGRRGAQ